MNKYKFKPGHEDVKIPSHLVKGGFVTEENCTDDLVDTIKKKYPQYAHNFVDADYVETSNESNEESNAVDDLNTLSVPELKKLASDKKISFKNNASQKELIELLKGK